MAKLHFTKMHGAGNDYIYVNTLVHNVADPSALSIRLSQYHYGIGSDGLVLIGMPWSRGADFSMRIFNADGSEAQMCGNASRCVGKYLYDNHLTTKTDILLDTLSGVRTLHLNVTDGVVTSVTVDMGVPVMSDERLFNEQLFLKSNSQLLADDRVFTGRFVSMGNPHFVIHVDKVAAIDVAHYGPLLENNPVFPEKSNIEFVEVVDDATIRMRVWERGSGITMACGTGACASTMADIYRNDHNRYRRVLMDGGEVIVEWVWFSHELCMTGPATHVFDGVIEI